MLVTIIFIIKATVKYSGISSIFDRYNTDILKNTDSTDSD